jgi:hypothetical protein
MWDWLIDEPSSAYWIVAGAGVLFLLVTVYTQRAVYLLGVIGAALVMALIALADYLVVTDRERVTLAVQAMVAAAEKQDADGILHHVADKFRSGSVDRATLEQELRRTLPHVARIRSGKLTVERSGDGTAFIAELNISFTGSYEGQVGESAPLLIRMRFEPAPDGTWKLMSAEVFDALGRVRYWPR